LKYNIDLYYGFTTASKVIKGLGKSDNSRPDPISTDPISIRQIAAEDNYKIEGDITE